MFLISTAALSALIEVLSTITGCAYCGVDFEPGDAIGIAPDLGVLSPCGQVHCVACVEQHADSIRRQGGRVSPDRADRYVAQFTYTTYSN